MTKPAASLQAGSAYLLVMVLIGAVSSLFAVGLAALVPPQARHRTAAEQRLGELRRLAGEDHRRSGGFAANLTALATRSSLPVDGSWRLDPYGSVADLRWRVAGRPSVVTVTSRGVDGRFGTADDLQFGLSDTHPGRARSRDHLRLLRARIVAWQASAGTPMAATERQQLIAASRDYVRCRRAYQTAGSAERASLTATMAACLSTIRALRTAAGVTFPRRVTGNRGLMRSLGLPDSAAVDGWNRTLVWNEAIGVVSRGGDNRGGTSDDF